MMRHSVQPRDRTFIKDYGFLFFTKNMGKNIRKGLSGKYSQKHFDHAKKSAIGEVKLFFTKGNWKIKLLKNNESSKKTHSKTIQ